MTTYHSPAEGHPWPQPAGTASNDPQSVHSSSANFGGTPSLPPTFPQDAPPALTSSRPHADFYQAAVINAGIPVVSLDATGRILAWNAAAVRMFGRSEAEVIGRPLETLIPSEYRPIASLAFQRTIQQRSVNIYEMSVVPQGGRNPVHVGVTLSCVTDTSSTQGGLKGVMAWMRDISSRKELEDHYTTIFTTFLKNAHTTDTVRSIRFLDPDTASVDIDWLVTDPNAPGGVLRKGLLNWIVTKRNGQWMIMIYHESAF